MVIKTGNENKHPKVSIGMPVYNGEKYIKEALDSLLNQSFEDFEFIISDNCSTDNTESICRTYAISDSRIRYVRHTRNMGAALNFQFALNESSGDYFIFASHDDVWEPNFLEVLVNGMTLKSNLVAMYFNIISIDEDGIEYGRRSEIIDTQGMAYETATSLLLFHGPPDIIYSLWKRPVIKSIIDSVYKNISENSYVDLLAISHTIVYMIPAFGEISTINSYLFKERKHNMASDSNIRPASLSDLSRYFRLLYNQISYRLFKRFDFILLILLITRQTSFVGLFYGPNSRLAKRFFKLISLVTTLIILKIFKLKRIDVEFS